MKAFPSILLATLCLTAALHAEEPGPVPAPPASRAESAESKPHAENAEAAEPGSPAGGAAERGEAVAGPHAEPAENAEPAASRAAELRAEVSLTDGSLLKGVLRRRFLHAESRILGRLRIDLSSVESIAFEPDPAAAARVTFRNGDLVNAVPAPEHDRLVLDTLLGPVAVPLRAVASLAVANDATDALVFHCTFDSPSSITRPAAGPAGRFLGGSFVPGKVGNALRVEKDAPAFESVLPTGFLGPEGCIEFWAKIEGDDPRYVDGGDPLFFSLYDERGSITLLQFAANNGFARGGLGGAMAGWPFGTIPQWSGSMPYAGVLGPAWADWHHYAMSWKAEGFGDGSFVKVFVDGRPQPVIGGVDDDKVPARLAGYGNHAYRLGVPWHSAAPDRRRSKKPFLIDELRIWSAAKTEFAK